MAADPAASPAPQPTAEMIQLLNDAASFELFLKELVVPDNTRRQHAENIFNQCRESCPDLLVQRLITSLRTSQDPQIRSFDAVLVRRVLTKTDLVWSALAEETKKMVKDELLKCVTEETVQSIRRKACDTVAEIGAGILENGAWPELLPFLSQCVSSDVETMKESALLIFAQLAQYVTHLLMQALPTLRGVFMNSLTAQSQSVKMAALRATSSFVQSLDGYPKERDSFQELVQPMLKTIEECFRSGDEATAQECLELFVEIAQSEPRFFRKHLDIVCNAMATVSETTDFEASNRQMALEFLVTLCEGREKAPGMMRKLPQYIGRMLQVSLKFLEDFDDEQEWHASQDEAEEDAGQGELYEAGQEALDRLALALGGKAVLPMASGLVQQYLSAADSWKKRNAAMVALAQIAEGCCKQMTGEIKAVVDLILYAIRDQQPQVRWAAINAIGQLSTDLGPRMQNEEHARLVPALVNSMADASMRVRAHATAAIVNFSEGCSSDRVEPYLDMIISKLIQLLVSQEARLVQEGALTALASVADCAQTFFVKYYDSVMPYLKTVLVQATDVSYQKLRGKSIECISLIGMAVGKEKFAADAKEVMDVLLAIQSQLTEIDDPIAGYMLQAWARLCKTLGDEFLPYLNVVMPPLLKTAAIKPDIKVYNKDDVDDEEEDDDVAVLSLGDQRLAIRTSTLEEKSTACSMLCCYAEELKGGFAPWIDEVAKVMLPLLRFYFHEDIRRAAVTCLPDLINCAKLAIMEGKAASQDPGYIKQLTDFCFDPLVESVDDPEPELIGCKVESIGEVIQHVGQELIKDDQLEKLTKQLLVVLESREKRVQERKARFSTEDFDDEERDLIESENETEDEILEAVVECLGNMLKAYGPKAHKYVDALLPAISAMLQPNRTAEEQRIAVCLFDDLIEFTNKEGAAVRYMEPYLPFIWSTAVSKEWSLRQAAVYGIGVCAEHATEAFRPNAVKALGILNQAILMQQSAEEAVATDNAVSAVGKICKFLGESVDRAQVIPAWLDLLPIYEDVMEARVAHEMLTEWVEKNDPAVLGANNQNLPKLVKVFAEVLVEGFGDDTGLVTAAVGQRMVAILKQMQASLSQELLGQCWSGLSSEAQQCLQAMLSAK